MDKGTADAGYAANPIYAWEEHMRNANDCYSAGFAGDPTGGLGNLPRTDRYMGLPAWAVGHIQRLEELIEGLSRRVSDLENKVTSEACRKE